MDANKYRTAYDKAQAVQHEVWTELCQHLEHAPDAQLLSDYTATLVGICSTAAPVWQMFSLAQTPKTSATPHFMAAPVYRRSSFRIL